MDRDDMLIRTGFYCAIASRLLHDDSYSDRYRGKAETLTEAGYVEMTVDIQARLLAAGFISADEDPFESKFCGRQSV